MRPGELEVALEWAAGEGWNPGVHDAACFSACDRDGFFIGLLDGDPVATIACVRYGPSYGFVGLYLVRRDLRGRGLGAAIWRAGHDHLDGRVSGLDAVDEQVASYERSGYRVDAHTYRHRGRGPGAEPGPDVVEVAEVPRDELRRIDGAAFPAPREEFLSAWTAQPDSRAVALRRKGRTVGYVVRRRCREGHKVGPLFAPDRAGAESLLDGAIDGLGADEDWWLDVPDSNPDGIALARDRALEVGFRTSRMYRGPAPSYDRSLVFGVTTLELG